MARSEEVSEAVAAARAAGCREMALLQCTSLYPAPAASLNLNAMATLAALGDCPVGYSDHHAGHLAVLAAVARGAKLIEKHFTLDMSRPGADHAISVEPDEFAAMVRACREIEAMLGTAAKDPVEAEVLCAMAAIAGWSASAILPAGTSIKTDDLYLMRLPAGREALPASRLRDVVGKRTRRSVSRMSGLTADAVEGLT